MNTAPGTYGSALVRLRSAAPTRASNSVDAARTDGRGTSHEGAARVI